jgi:hypothetical protein
MIPLNQYVILKTDVVIFTPARAELRWPREVLVCGEDPSPESSRIVLQWQGTVDATLGAGRVIPLNSL